jgi:O-antigen ligase
MMAPAELTNRFHSIKIKGAATNGDEDSSRTHFELLKAGVAMIESSPLTGVGLERFKSVAPLYNRELLDVAGRRYIAHNTYLQIGAETGLPVLILFLALMTTAFVNCRAGRRSGDAPLAGMAKAIQLGLIGYSVAALSVTAEYITTFWILVFLSQNLREIVDSIQVQNAQMLRQAIVKNSFKSPRASISLDTPVVTLRPSVAFRSSSTSDSTDPR